MKPYSNYNDYKPNSTISDDFREQNIKYTLSKKDDDLYREENDIVGGVLRVKWVGLPNHGDRWKILNEQSKTLFVIEGSKLSKKERLFLRSIDGFNFLIAQFKGGLRSFNALKMAIKQKLKKSSKKTSRKT
jgi:hypothetical protein